jgi:hypothetical protein
VRFFFFCYSFFAYSPFAAMVHGKPPFQHKEEDMHPFSLNDEELNQVAGGTGVPAPGDGGVIVVVPGSPPFASTEPIGEEGGTIPPGIPTES